KGNIILDVAFSEIVDELEVQMKSIVGVVETGLFISYADEVLVAKADGVFSLLKKQSSVVEKRIA
ncbi:MAG: ribose-5-phosphate isomerase A, partial [Bdellovibrionales bacterium]|nr:ribose-5-phosphate isomerase A [Bdellovibrionales bacterium]